MKQLKALVWSFINCSSYALMYRTHIKDVSPHLVTVLNHAKTADSQLIMGDVN